MTSTLIDIRLPSGVVVNPAAICAGEHSWYSFSLSVKHHSGRSILSMGASIVAVKLESTISAIVMLCSFGFALRSGRHDPAVGVVGSLLSMTICRSEEVANKIGDPIGCAGEPQVPRTVHM